MKNAILYAIIAAAAIAIVGCGGDFGDGGAESDAFLDKFHSGKRVKKFTVTYDGNDNDGGVAPVDDGSPYDSGTYVSVKPKGSLAKTGHNFTMWATEKNGSGATYSETSGFRISKNVTLYAQWKEATIPTYKVEVSSSITGTGASGSGDYEQGDTVKINAGTAPNDWRFLNWTVTSGNVSVEDASEPATSFIMPRSRVQVMAVFGAAGGETGWFTDGRDSKSYKTVKIGEQTWMAQNLNFTTSSGSWCYGNDPNNCNTYGRLYDWSTAMGACPVGWHLPTHEEWGDLAIGAGGIGAYGEEGSAGTNLKAKAPDWDGTDSYEFSALPGGSRYTGSDDTFSGIGGEAHWWTATGSGGSGAYRRYISYGENLGVRGDFETDGLSVRCIKGDSPPQIELEAPSGITATAKAFSVTISWLPVRRANGYVVYRRTNPSDEYTMLEVISATSYTDAGVTSGTTYYYKVSAYNSDGECPRYSEVSATTETVTKIIGTLTDSRNGKEYKTATIDGKTWMAENLNYVPQSGNSWCYENDNSNCNTYGRLYDWATAMNIDELFNNISWNGSDVKRQGVCPTGWHLPSNQEWDDLVAVLGRDAGKKLKATSGWNWDGNGTDDYGFSALPSGGRGASANVTVGSDGNWWTATESGNTAYLRMIYFGGSDVFNYNNSKSYGFSVRCVMSD